MSDTLERVGRLVREGKVRISGHGYEELSAEGITVREVLSGLRRAELVEDSPDYPKGPCVLVLEYDDLGRALHAVWESPRGAWSPRCS